MISADSITNLNTSIVFQASGGGFDQGEPGLLLGAGLEGLGQLIDAPTVQQSPDGPVLLSMRNQFTLTITPSILAFGDASGDVPARADFPGRVARVAGYIGNQSHVAYSRAGFVFDIESKPADHESAEPGYVEAVRKGRTSWNDRIRRTRRLSKVVVRRP